MRRAVLPDSLPPVGVNREQAAAFIGIGATLFDQLVIKRQMPQPRLLGARQVWDVAEVVEAFRHLPHRESSLDGDSREGNPWDHE